MDKITEKIYSLINWLDEEGGKGGTLTHMSYLELEFFSEELKKRLKEIDEECLTKTNLKK
jgi:hypothetical protein